MRAYSVIMVSLVLLAAQLGSTSAGAGDHLAASRQQNMPTPTPLVLGPQIDPALRTPTPLPVDPPQATSERAAMGEMPGNPPQPTRHGMPAVDEGSAVSGMASGTEQASTAALAPPGAVVATLGANVRDMPHRAGSQVLMVLLRGDAVTLTGQLADRTWFRVLAPSVEDQPGVDGWMHHSVLDIDPATLGRIPVAAGELIAGGMTMLLPASADGITAPAAAKHAPVVPAPEISGVASASGVIVTEMPPGLPDPGLPPIRPELPLSLVLQACYDGNQNRACDVDEGIAGLTVYASEPHTARLLGQALTDAGGIARLTVRVAQDGQAAVAVPYFGATQTTGTSGRLQPVIVMEPVPIPALLP